MYHGKEIDEKFWYEYRYSLKQAQQLISSSTIDIDFCEGDIRTYSTINVDSCFDFTAAVVMYNIEGVYKDYNIYGCMDCFGTHETFGDCFHICTCISTSQIVAPNNEPLTTITANIK